MLQAALVILSNCVIVANEQKAEKERDFEDRESILKRS